jgi:hypothetical protein
VSGGRDGVVERWFCRDSSWVGARRVIDEGWWGWERGMGKVEPGKGILSVSQP